MSGINSRHIFSYTKVMQIKHKIKLAANKFRLQSIIFPSRAQPATRHRPTDSPGLFPDFVIAYPKNLRQRV